MLVSFSVGNFRSFKETVKFSMVAANITAKKKVLDKENVFQISTVALLKSAAIYGANASGKSNLLAAFKFMRRFIMRSTQATSQDSIGVEPFLLSSETDTAPSFFEVVFIVDDVQYRYGFEIDQIRVHAEWLYRTKQRETELFWREGLKIDHNRTGFKEGREDLKERTRENALFVSVVDQWNGAIAGEIVGWFKKANTISGLNDTAYLGFTVDKMIENDIVGLKIAEFVKQIDLGILAVQAEKRQVSPTALATLLQQEIIPAEVRAKLSESEWFTPIVKTTHNRYNEANEKIGQVEFSLDSHESEGTKKAFALSGPILHSLLEGRVLFVDELDARLHPLITRHIIELFNSTETNPHNAQLIFVTHDTNLLGSQLFRRDQIWFTEKNRYGATDLYSLVEYELPVRSDASFESDYISGKYGAIPYIGNIKRLVGSVNE